MRLSTLCSLCLLAVATVASAQDAPILREKQITQDVLINALTPAAAPAQGPRTRSIRVQRDDSPAASARRPSASLLITFETNSASLTPRAKRALDVLAQALASDKLASFRFGIEGYADPRGLPDNNLKLSQARAEAVRDYLVASKNIERDRLQPVGKGDKDLLNKANPIAPENRRVTIVNLSTSS